MKNIEREKFTTTLGVEHKTKLATLAGYKDKDKNELIEQWIEEKWEEFLHEMANQSNSNGRTNK